MRDVASKIFPDDDMPRRAMPSIKFFLDLSCDVLLDVVFLEGGGSDVHALLLHFLAHVDVLDDGLGNGAALVLGARRGLGRHIFVLVTHLDKKIKGKFFEVKAGESPEPFLELQ
jgi:hypothetical protein